MGTLSNFNAATCRLVAAVTAIKTSNERRSSID